MAADENKKETAAAAAGPTQTVGQTKIVWDDSNMRSVYANVANVAGGREEIVLLFGMNQAWHAGNAGSNPAGITLLRFQLHLAGQFYGEESQSKKRACKYSIFFVER